MKRTFGQPVVSLNDLVCRSEKNEVLIPWCSEKIVHMAVNKQMYDVVHHFSSFLTSNPYQLAQSNGEHIAESYFGMKYNSKVVCGHGFDLDNGVDVKTCFVRSGATSAHIGNTSVKESLAILIIHEDGRIIETKEEIPVPGDEDSISIPLTKNFKIWDQYDFADCFYPEDVEADPDRYIHGKWADKGIMNVNYSNDTPGGRLRINCKRGSFEKVKKGENDLVLFFKDNEDFPVYLNLDYFRKTFRNPFAASIALNCDLVSSVAKHRFLFPKFMIYGMSSIHQVPSDAARFLDGSLDERNIETFKKIVDSAIAMKI